MLIVLVAAYFLASGGGATYFGAGIEVLEKRIASIVSESSRQEAALNIIGTLDDDTEVANKSIAAQMKKLKDVHGDYEASVEDYHTVLDGLEADLDHCFEASLDARKALRQSVTPEEWVELFSAQ